MRRIWFSGASALVVTSVATVFDKTAALAQVAPAGPTTPAAANTVPDFNPGLHLDGTTAAAFIGSVVVLVLAVWLYALMNERRQAWKVGISKMRLAEKLLKAHPDPAGDELDAIVSALQYAPPDVSSSQSPGTGLTGSLLALLILTLVALALAVSLLSGSTDAGDLRKTIITSLLSILATIGGFYFGQRATQAGAAGVVVPVPGPVVPGPVVPGPVVPVPELVVPDPVVPDPPGPGPVV